MRVAFPSTCNVWATFIIISLVFLALLYMYNVIHCIMSIIFPFCVLPTQNGFDYECFTEATGVEEDFSF